MGAFWLSRVELIGTTSEIVGHKSGLALTRSELARFVPVHLRDLWLGADRILLRVRSEEFEELIAAALYGVGNIPTPSIAFPGIRLFHKYKNDPSKNPIFMDMMGIFPEFLQRGMAETEAAGKRAIDPTPFLKEARGRHGHAGTEVALEVIQDLDLYLHRSPWSQYRRVEWRDSAQLTELFQSESLETFYGSFIDQRFINYLARNFHDIDRINWRKFEALTCEFFERSGFYVEIGEGRDDGNIDARIWPKRESQSLPPTILVQCKRQRAKVGKVVIKALWADILEERAGSGLIVTTSALSPGAEKVCTARGYAIGQAKRETLRKWIEAMRTPGAGIFMGE